MKNKSFGFTMIELLVVIAIIGVLAAIVLVSVSQAKLKSLASAANSQVSQYINAVELYRTNNNGDFPYFGSGSPVCLGHYPGNCGPGGTMSNSAALEAKLAPYIAGNPPVNITLPFTGGGNAIGAFAVIPNVSAMNIVWYLPANTTCARGAASTIVSGVTQCTYSF